MNIVLVGFMGTGKSTVGRELAKKLRMKFVDTDAQIEEGVGLPIYEIFSKFGEGYFRDVEKKVVQSVSKKNNYVISTGGGVVLDEENMLNLRKNGKIVCLFASPKYILERVKDETKRPLLMVGDPEKRVKELLKFREQYYKKADIKVKTDGLTPKEIVEKIVQKLQKRAKSRTEEAKEKNS